MAAFLPEHFFKRLLGSLFRGGSLSFGCFVGGEHCEHLRQSYPLNAGAFRMLLIPIGLDVVEILDCETPAKGERRPRDQGMQCGAAGGRWGRFRIHVGC